jgi:hypothetical protein
MSPDFPGKKMIIAISGLPASIRCEAEEKRIICQCTITYAIFVGTGIPGDIVCHTDLVPDMTVPVSHDRDIPWKYSGRSRVHGI